MGRYIAVVKREGSFTVDEIKGKRTRREKAQYIFILEPILL